MRLPNVMHLAAVQNVNAALGMPGSKSITNRAFILAALASGRSVLRGALLSDDTLVMSQCLKALGIRIENDAEPSTVAVDGAGGKFATPSAELFAGNSGTTIRFLTAAACYAPAESRVILDGIARMRQRPIVDLVEALQQLGVTASTSANGCPPVTVTGGGMRGGRCLIKGTMSSQYLSALLMACPYAQNDVSIVVDGDLVSKPYVDITLSMMSDFGVPIQNDSYRKFFIPGSQEYTGREYNIEPDASNASYFMAAAAVTGGVVTINGLGTSSIQGDVSVAEVFERMGCRVQRGVDSLTVAGPPRLTPIDFDCSEIPDMAQTIAVVAAFASGPSRLTGLRTLRVKETDRITAMAIELAKIGAAVTEGSDNLLISPGEPKTAVIDTYDDHRMAMSFAIAGLRIDGLKINDPGCVAKTFPDFWSRWAHAFPGSVVGGEKL